MATESGIRPLTFALAAVVLLNYVAQVPYDWHLYRLHLNPVGVLLLLGTLGWFLAGFVLMLHHHPLGYWLSVSFLATDFTFYLVNAVMGSVHGYGPLYQLTRVSDPVLWTVFLIGYINFVAAGLMLWLLMSGRWSGAVRPAG